jgi:hypothetical protein
MGNSLSEKKEPEPKGQIAPKVSQENEGNQESAVVSNPSVFLGMAGSGNFTYQKPEWMWPNSLLPYKIHQSIQYRPQIFAKVQEAIKEFTQKGANIGFENITDQNPHNHHDWVLFIHDKDDTSSRVGRRKGEQVIKIADWAEKGNIIHEIMHALGFLHEHCRLDRDGYVLFNESKNPSVGKHNYIKEGHPVGDYDLSSIMHYFLCEYIYSNHPEAIKMGQRVSFSKGDLKAIKFVYGPPVCTYDHFGEEYHIQNYYECLTCWGENSCFGACEYCAFNCHKGHTLNKFSLEFLCTEKITFVCDCGRYKHKQQLCTRQSTKKKYVKQSMYVCHDCFDVKTYSKKNGGNIPGMCFSCSKTCHLGHNKEFFAFSEGFFCDCGLECCKVRCKIQV